MIRLLLKKQIAEIFRGYVYNQKKNQVRSKGGTLLMILLFAFVMIGIVGGMFGYLASVLCEPFAAVKMEWFFFALIGLMSILLGVFGSVFSTYSGLYLSKDNDFLLSMPVPPRAIIVSRLLSVYVMGLMYSAVVFIPAVAVYFYKLGFDAMVLFGSLMLLITVSLIDLILSCVLGFVVAKISVKLKNRSFATVFISVAFIVIYYILYFKAGEMLSTLLQNITVVGDTIIGRTYPVYLFGKVGTGDTLAVSVFVGASIILTAAVYIVLTRTFINIVTSNSAVAKVKSVDRVTDPVSPSKALFRKEVKMFTSNPMYMINCGIGVLLIPALGIFAIIKRDYVSSMLPALSGVGVDSVAVIAALLVCVCSMMNDTTAPSVSLEGKRLWISQSLPVTPWQVIRAKILLHLTVTVPPVVFCIICMFIAFELSSTVLYILVALCALSFNVLLPLIGMFFGLKLPNLTWTRDVVPIKQGGAVGLTILCGFAIPCIVGVGYFAFGNKLGATSYLAIADAVFIILSSILYRWCKTKGCKIFAEL